jgi:aspartyl-tRNA synthetase
MAFSGSEEVISVIERLVKTIWNRVFPHSVDTDMPFERMTYHDAMSKVCSTINRINKSMAVISRMYDTGVRWSQCVLS